VQALALGVTIAWSAIATVALVWIVKLVIGLRVTPEQESEGLDRAEHGENGYTLES
jgi:Amt family ammonium transporter